MKIEQILNETIINLSKQEDTLRNYYKDEVYDMLQKAYQSIGGLKGHGFLSPEDMVSSIPFWKLSIRDGVVNAVLMYRDKNGRKRVAMATDGSKEAKEDLANMLRDEYKTKRAYAEISDSSLRFHKKILGDELDNITVPAEEAIKHIDDDFTRSIPDEPYEYERLIGNKWIRKRLVGNINSRFY